MKFGHKVLLLGGTVAIGYGLLAWYLPAAARKKEQAALDERLDSIESSLATLLERDGQTGSTDDDELVGAREAGMRLSPGSRGDRLADGLERLIDTLEAQTRLLASARAEAVSLDDLRKRFPEPDTTELTRMHVAWGADRDAVRRELQLLSRAEVLARFGTPSGVQDGGWSWSWGSTDSSDPAWRRMVLSFDGDYVHDVRISD